MPSPLQMTASPYANLNGVNRRRTSVLHVGKFYPPHMGGIETHLQVLCEGLRETVDLSVIVSSDDATAVEEEVEGVAISRLAAPVTLFSTPICPAMTREIRASRADIVHLHLPNPAAAAAYLASGRRGALVVSYHSDIVRQRYMGKLVEPIIRAVLRRSSAIVVSSPEIVRYSPVIAGFRDRCHVIPYGIRLDEFTKCDPILIRSLREKHGDRLILSVGRLVYYKGFEYLIRAMVKVRGKLLIVGQGPLQPKLEELIRQLGVTDKVCLTGNVQDAVPYYHAAAVFALASVARSEAFGIVQIEAMAAGIPVVNTNLQTAVPYVSVHEQTGLTVPPADPEALATALNLMLDNQQLRESLGRAARLRAHTEFSDETMTKRMTALYQNVMQA
jgi:glycosyltransferase involved in cell wall biosynthesis